MIVLSVLIAFAADWIISCFRIEISGSAIFTDGHEVIYTSSCEINGNQYIVTGGDPQFAVPAYEGEEISRIHILFDKPLAQDTDLQVFYAFPGVDFNETDSVIVKIPRGTLEKVLKVPRTNYTYFRFDFEQDVDLKGIYSENEIRVSGAYYPHVICIILFFLETFCFLWMLICCVTKMKHETPDIEWRGINPTILLCNLAFALTLFIFQPYTGSIEKHLIPVNTWWIQLLFAGGLTLILTWLMSLLKPLDGKIAASISLGIGIAVAIQGFLFNEGKIVELNTNSDLLNIIYWVGIVILTVAMVADRLQKEEKKRTHIAMRIAAWVLILFQAVNLTVLWTRTEVQHTAHEQSVEVKEVNDFGELMKFTVKNGLPYFIKDFIGE